jgi:hypothetical protein
MDMKPTQVKLKLLYSRQEGPKKNPFVTSHSNLLVEAWKRVAKR